MMTPEQAQTLIEQTEANAPDRIPAACNMIAKASIKWAQQSLSRDKKIYGELAQVKKLLQQAAQAAGMVAPAEAEEGAEPAHADAAPPSIRMNADGTQMSAEEAAMEDAMDAAVDGLAPNANAPAPSPLPVAEAAAEVVPVAAAPAAAPTPPNGRAAAAKPKPSPTTDAKA